MWTALETLLADLLHRLIAALFRPRGCPTFAQDKANADADILRFDRKDS